MEQFLERLMTMAYEAAPRVIGAILILVLGRIVAGFVSGALRRIFEKRELDPSLTNFITSIVSALIMVFAVVAAIARFGVQTASFVAVMGALAFAVGLALQGSLSNFAAGIMVLLFRPYRVGQYIEGGGVSGTVKDIQLFCTVLATPDNVQIIVPNGTMYSDVIKNYSAHDTRRVDFTVGIAYGSSIQTAFEVLERLVKEEKRFLADPAHQIVVGELADSSVNVILRGWVNAPDYWDVKFDVTRRIKEEFDKTGIEIPFPQRVVHMVNQAS